MRISRSGAIILIIWALFLSGVVSLYLTYLQPSRLGKTVSDALESSLGTPVSIRQVDFFFFPNPAVRIHGLKVEQAGKTTLEFRSDLCAAQLSWTSLFRLKPVLRSIELQGPIFDITLPAKTVAEATVEDGPRESPLKHVEMTMPASLPVLPPSITGIRADISNGIVRLRQEESSMLVLLNGISGSARLPGLFSGNIDLSIRTGKLRLGKAPLITLSKLSFQVSSITEDLGGDITGNAVISTNAQMNSLEETFEHPIAEEYQYFPLPEPALIRAELGISASPSTGTVTVKGMAATSLVLPMNGHPTPISLTVPFSMNSLDVVDIEDMKVSMGDDHGIITGTLTGLRDLQPVLTGQLQIGHFSLIRWFPFGRSMTTGLQVALDNITGTLDFVLTPKGVIAPQLKARVMDIDLTGSGKCEDFLNPDVVISAHTKYANLDSIFPELLGIKTLKPDLPPPAIPIRDEDDPANQSPAKVSFHINIDADAVDICKLQAGKAACRIFPLRDPYAPPTDKKELALMLQGKSGAQMTIDVGNLYGGKITSRTILESPYRVTAQVKNTEIEGIVTPLAGFAAINGKLNATTAVSFFGNSPGEMISNLNVSIDGTLANGFFGSKSGYRVPYHNLKLVGTGAAVSTNKISEEIPNYMDIKGLWDILLDMGDYRVSTKSDAILNFSMHTGLPVKMAPQPVDAKLTLLNKGIGGGKWPGDIAINLSGKTSFDLESGHIAVSNLNGKVSKFDISGSLTASNIYEKLTVEGPLTVKTTALNEASPIFGITLPHTIYGDKLKHFVFGSHISYTHEQLHFNKITATLDNTPITGNLSLIFARRPLLTGNLHLGAVNGDRYFPEPNANSNNPIPTDSLMAFDMDTKIQVTDFTLFETPIKSLTVPITLTNGKLTASVFTALFPGGGTLTGTYHGETIPPVRKDGKITAPGFLSNRLQLRLTEINMLGLTQSRGGESLISGTGTFQFDTQALLRNWSDIPKKLDGNWSMLMLNGYFSNKTGEAAYTAAKATPHRPLNVLDNTTKGMKQVHSSPRTNFQRVSASGAILNGVLSSNNFIFSSSTLDITGKAAVNLNDKTVNASLIATFLGVPEIPVEISGPWDNPSRSYKYMGAVTGTINNIASGLVDTVGSIFSSPFKGNKK